LRDNADADAMRMRRSVNVGRVLVLKSLRRKRRRSFTVGRVLVLKSLRRKRRSFNVARVLSSQ
jgi:hypothetical protein